MGWHTDFFLAHPADAAAIADSEDPFGGWPCLSLKGVGDTELRALWGVIRGDNAGDVSGDLYFPDEFAEDHDGPLIYGLNAEFVRDLATLTHEQCEEAAAAWGRTEEMDGWKRRELLGVAVELSDFARRSVAERTLILQQFVL